MYSSYRSDNIGEDCLEILENDSKWVNASFKEKDIFYLMAYIGVMLLSIVKVIIFFFKEIRKPEMTYDHLDFERGMFGIDMMLTLERREALSENVPKVRNHDHLCPNDKIKTQKADTINSLRNYLYQHNLTLTARIIKKVNHRRTEEELLEMYRIGEITNPLSTVHITFGENLNGLLKEVLQDIVDLRKDRFSGETYIKVLNDDFHPIKTALYNMFNENVKIEFDEIKNN